MVFDGRDYSNPDNWVDIIKVREKSWCYCIFFFIYDFIVYFFRFKYHIKIMILLYFFLSSNKMKLYFYWLKKVCKKKYITETWLHYIFCQRNQVPCVLFLIPFHIRKTWLICFFFFKINFKYKLPFLKEIKFKIEIIG